ncbi:MAG: aminotransferase class I/II-fold pyridoxal phosphate-dependent enzyme [Firmicutes bacterium]|nr:aminotransferase class I/II-fold pyridoxal phosphate-dependent enzyme [Bacillota bacterium]
MTKSERLETLFVHAGQPRQWPQQVPTAPPIVPSTSFRTSSPEEMDSILGGEVPGFTYSRHANPTVEAFQEAVRLLEAGEVAQAFGSGMAALDAALYAVGLKPGDRLLLSIDLYGATMNLSHDVWGAMGLDVREENLTDGDAWVETLEKWRPQAILVESLSNPLMKVPDMERLMEEAHRVGAQVIVDNTFATPCLFRPMVLGADVVVHSATKYIGGHGDAVGGVVVARREHANRLHQYVKLRGSVLSPFDAWLLHRGLKTLGVRFERQCRNAWELAERLDRSGAFRRVYYPGLKHHPSHERATSLFGGRGYGAVVTVEVPGGRERVFRLLSRLKIVGSATTVGDVYTLCLYPRIASHRNQTPDALKAMGISDETLRIAVGLEAVEDIAADILQALES